jgi:hypothetical protein
MAHITHTREVSFFPKKDKASLTNSPPKPINLLSLVLRHYTYIKEHSIIQPNSKFHEHFVLQKSSLEAVKQKITRQEEFVEVFYDTESNQLLSSTDSCWLKFAKGTWSLKKQVCLGIHC